MGRRLSLKKYTDVYTWELWNEHTENMQVFSFNESFSDHQASIWSHLTNSKVEWASILHRVQYLSSQDHNRAI